VPENTDFQIKLVAFLLHFKKSFTTSTDWAKCGKAITVGYVLLPENTSPSSVNQQFKSFVKKYLKEDASKQQEYLQPLSQVHYDEEAGNLWEETISKKLVNVLWLIAGFILLIACVNFVNLSTAHGY
jgi:hypothetical protein